MNLRIFDFDPMPEDKPKKRSMKDKFNGATGYWQCRFLEWTGWYNMEVYQRLLGHYRLFQHFKKDKYLKYSRLPVLQAYILQYRATQGIKYLISKVMCFIYTTITREVYAQVEIEGLNRILVNEGADVLQQFLTDAEVDFEQALLAAAEKINAPDFICRTAKGTLPPVQVQVKNEFIQVNQEVNNHQENSYSFQENNETNSYSYTKVVNMSSVIKEGPRGKEKGVFSKKQALILFDLLSEAARLEKIDFGKPNKFDAIAEFLHALTGKSKESWMEELNDYRSRGLYDAYTLGELKELIGTVTNCAEICRNAGFRSVANLADKKIKELEMRKKTWDQ